MNEPKEHSHAFIKKVEKLPEYRPARQDQAYTEVMESMEKAKEGIYEIHIPNKKPTAILNALRKRIKTQDITNLKVYIRNQTIYILKRKE